MPSNDLMHRFLFDHTDIRGEIVTLHESYAEVISHNATEPVIQGLLGEFLAAVSLLSSTLKFDGVLTLQARGDGPLPLIMAECTHHQEMRAIAKPTEGADLSATTLRELLGSGGVLSITIDPAKGQRYQGIVPLDADNLAGCLEHYFLQSEQLKTRFWLSADVDNAQASGLLLQALPQQLNASPEENLQHWESTCALANTVKDEELLQLEHSAILYRLFNEEQVRLFDPSPVRFNCSCSRARSLNALRSLGEEEVGKLLADLDNIDIDCQFCNQHYSFNNDDIAEIFGKPDKPLH